MDYSRPRGTNVRPPPVPDMDITFVKAEVWRGQQVKTSAPGAEVTLLYKCDRTAVVTWSRVMECWRHIDLDLFLILPYAFLSI